MRVTARCYLKCRYVEYFGRLLAYASDWQDHMVECPVGCLDVRLTWWFCRGKMKEYKRRDRLHGCSNFEYKTVRG